jgi:hypothetical protein
MGDKYYAHEKFASAVRYLAVHDGTRRSVLREARARFTAVSDTDMPTEEAAEEFRALMRRLTWAEDTTGEGTIPATIAAMDDSEARAIAGAIVDLCFTLENAIKHALINGERWGTHHELAAQEES